ncbi:phosphotransferase [Agrobacterium sp. NPDC090273]|uniref:phosphotransferase n=1 Tax=Agrobacterium sp. NPDC090273 TaxID=3363919 RepID=UPI00383BEC26
MKIEFVDGGTLGLCFTGELLGQKRFFKTYANPAGRSSLEREAAFLVATAGARVDAGLNSVTTGPETRTWLSMKVLQPGYPLHPQTVRDTVSCYERALSPITTQLAIPSSESFDLLLSEANAAVATLSQERLISGRITKQVRNYLDLLLSAAPAWERQICHGDLSPANIRSDDMGPVVVDWEDAFWGIAGYDYLYWLTFFENRKWLLPEHIGYTCLGKKNEVAIMTTVIVLKSIMSVRNDSYRANAISFDQRLTEVIKLDCDN